MTTFTDAELDTLFENTDEDSVVEIDTEIESLRQMATRLTKHLSQLVWLLGGDTNELIKPLADDAPSPRYKALVDTLKRSLEVMEICREVHNATCHHSYSREQASMTIGNLQHKIAALATVFGYELPEEMTRDGDERQEVPF